MAIITLTTDWNKGDYYLGAVKGKILSKDPATQIVDINHQIMPFNIMQAAFIMRNCCFEYPEGTVHIIAVNSALTPKRPLLVLEIKGQYIITADNGIAGLLSGDDPEKVFKVDLKKNLLNFHGLDAYVETAFNIIDKKPFDQFCSETIEFEKQIPLRPVIDRNLINGSVIYIDSFSNVITNVSKETFDKVGQGKRFEIFVQSNHYKIVKLNKTYSNSVSGELLAMFNSIGLLEVAINHGNAADLLSLSINSAIRIKFYDEIPENQLKLSGN